jgi:peptidoglycan/xylan/chitin deacetylase (PgdA/CDA1 family)
MKAIITYHSIDRSGSVISMDPEVFREHLEWFARSEVSVVGLSELAGRTSEGGDAVALTFDDAFANYASEALPLLEAHGFSSTVFVPTGHVGKLNGWETGEGRVPSLPLMGWEALGRLCERGVELGSHSRTHPDLRRVSKAQLEDEVSSSAERIRAETGQEAEAFAYPYGFHDDDVVAAVRRRYARAVTTEFRELRGHDDVCRLPRLDACYFRERGRLERWGTASFRRFLTWRRGLRSARNFFTRG